MNLYREIIFVFVMNKVIFIAILVPMILLMSCTEDKPVLYIGGIPDQNVSLLEERFDGIANYLQSELGIEVRYKPSISYSALVTSFANGEVKLAWFGGLTGVQARSTVNGGKAIIQRPKDENFRSVFIVNNKLNVRSLKDLKGYSLTFGSESSTSGHLMPRFFLMEAGLNPESDFKGPPSYSGSHDKTWKLVESGSFEIGALNAAVWDRAVSQESVDNDKVRSLKYTGTYADYHWVAHPAIETKFGDGVIDKISNILKSMEMSNPEAARILDLFQTDSFVDTQNENYSQIENTARSLGLLK